MLAPISSASVCAPTQASLKRQPSRSSVRSHSSELRLKIFIQYDLLSLGAPSDSRSSYEPNARGSFRSTGAVQVPPARGLSTQGRLVGLRRPPIEREESRGPVRSVRARPLSSPQAGCEGA